MSVLNDAYGKARSFVDGLIVPKYREKSEEPLAKGELWSSNITNSMCKKAYERMGITRKLVDKLAGDVFDNWFKIKSSNPKLPEEVNTVFKNLKLKYYLKQARTVGIVEGYAALALGFNDEAELDKPVQGATKLEYVSLLAPADITKFILDEDLNSETFGELIGIDVRVGKGSTKTIHSSRFIYLPVNVYGNSIKGIGLVRPAYNYLTVVENVIWSTGQAFYRYASGFPHIQKKGGKGIDTIKAQWKEVNSLTGWASDENTKIEFVGARAVSLDPEQYFRVAIESVAMAFDIPYQVVVGAAAGAVTGSEMNLMDYYSDISSKQDIDFTPIIVRLIKILQEIKQVSQGDSFIEWNSLWEMDAKEKAEIEKINAETQKIQIEAGIRDPEKIKAELEKKLTMGDQPELEFRYDGRTKLKAKRVEQITDDYIEQLQKLFTIQPILQAIKASELGERVGDQPDEEKQILIDDFRDLEKELELIEKTREQKIKRAVDENVDIAWDEGWNTSNELLSMDIISTEKAAQIRKIIKQSNYAFVNGIGKDVTKKVLFEVQQSILAGESYAQMAKKIEKIIGASKADAERIARTETVRTLSESVKQSYRDTGIVEKVEWITASDEVVCLDCGSLDGQIFDLNSIPSQPLHPNCRCTLVANFGRE